MGRFLSIITFVLCSVIGLAQTVPVRLVGPNTSAITTGIGNTDANLTYRVVIASDQPAIAVTSSGTGAVNLTQVGGASIAIGQAAMAASLPVVIASNQGNLNVVVASALPTGTNVIGHVITDSGSVAAATQSGTWTVQPGNTANTTAWKVDGSAVTQPISVASLPLPSGASTAAKQPALGTAGSASTDVITIQGVASMTKLLVTPDSVALPANQSVNVSQMNGVTTLMGNGVSGTGAQRVVIASDNTAFSVNAVESGTWNVNSQWVNTAGSAVTPTYCTSSAVFDTSASGRLALVAASGSTKVYICKFSAIDVGGGNTFQLQYGTGATCGTGTVNFWMVDTTIAATAEDFNSPLITPASQAVCINLTNATRVTGGITYAQY